MTILTEADGAEVDLTVAENTLKTTMRRLHDAINVLAGVNVVQRTGKSRMRLLQIREDSRVQGNARPIG
jgi:hypothetical protein